MAIAGAPRTTMSFIATLIIHINREINDIKLMIQLAYNPLIWNVEDSGSLIIRETHGYHGMLENRVLPCIQPQSIWTKDE